MNVDQNGEGEAQPKTDGVRVETMNGRQELIVPGRFELSWPPDAVDALSDDAVAEFQRAMTGLMAHARDELSPNEDTRAEAAANRTDALLNLATVLRVSGASIAYPSRNTRYTSMDGVHFMPEEIVPGRGMDEQGPHAGIPNSLNAPDL